MVNKWQTQRINFKRLLQHLTVIKDQTYDTCLSLCLFITPISTNSFEVLKSDTTIRNDSFSPSLRKNTIL